MDCLIDSIGLAGCGTSSPVSGLFINGLPGISLESIESLADSEQATYSGVWSDVQTRAAKRFRVAVTSELNKRYKIGLLSYSLNYKTQPDTSDTTAAAAGYRGITFDLDYSTDTNVLKRSSLQNHYIQTAYYYHVGAPATVTIRVIDQDTGTSLYNSTISAVAGWNTKAVNTSFTARRIILGVECTSLTTVRTDIPNSTNWYKECGVRVEGAIGSGTTYTDTNENTHGVGAVYSVQCSYESLVCNNKDNFYLAWWYCLGSELTIERMFSKRINKWTLNKKEGEELRAFFDVEFEKTLSQACQGINLNCDDVCLDCGSWYNIRESHFGC